MYEQTEEELTSVKAWEDLLAATTSSNNNNFTHNPQRKTNQSKILNGGQLTYPQHDLKAKSVIENLWKVKMSEMVERKSQEPHEETCEMILKKVEP